ncbi:unnamed protein product [Arctogadus glacialis]
MWGVWKGKESGDPYEGGEQPSQTPRPQKDQQTAGLWRGAQQGAERPRSGRDLSALSEEMGPTQPLQQKTDTADAQQ